MSAINLSEKKITFFLVIELSNLDIQETMHRNFLFGETIGSLTNKIYLDLTSIPFCEQVSQGCIDVAGQLLMSGCPSTDIAAPTAEEMEQAVVRLNALNEKNLRYIGDQVINVYKSCMFCM